MNTLKALGCEISRPTRSNGYRYQLSYHPFSHFLTQQDVQTIKDIFLHFDDRIDYWNMIYFQRWLQRVFEKATNKDRLQGLQQLMTELRMIDYQSVQQLVSQLEQYSAQRQLIRITYKSAVSDVKLIDFLPQKIFHHQGVLYLLGFGPDWDRASMLRLDKIEQVEPLDNPALAEELLQKQQHKQTYVLRFLNCSAKDIDTFGEDQQMLRDPVCTEHLLIKFRTDNEFLLTQTLLTLGYRFQILYPQTYKQELLNTVREMRQLYTA